MSGLKSCLIDNAALGMHDGFVETSIPMKFKSAAAALKAFGPDGTRPLTGIRLVQKGRSSWTVELRKEDLTWEGMAHFAHASEVVEWANRFA